jgi:Domain of unknown function (DUF4258)
VRDFLTRSTIPVLKIRIDPHALARLPVRGVSADEVLEVLTRGEAAEARGERCAKELVFTHERLWAGRFYAQKKVKVVYMIEGDEIVVTTVLAYYGRWS